MLDVVHENPTLQSWHARANRVLDLGAMTLERLNHARRRKLELSRTCCSWFEKDILHFSENQPAWVVIESRLFGLNGSKIRF